MPNSRAIRSTTACGMRSKPLQPPSLEPGQLQEDLGDCSRVYGPPRHAEPVGPRMDPGLLEQQRLTAKTQTHVNEINISLIH